MKTTAFVIYSILFLAVADHLQAQNYIGMHKDQIIETMKETEKQLKLNTSTVNPHYNYLKYEDKINEITVLFFLSEDDFENFFQCLRWWRPLRKTIQSFGQFGVG